MPARRRISTRLLLSLASVLASGATARQALQPTSVMAAPPAVAAPAVAAPGNGAGRPALLADAAKRVSFLASGQFAGDTLDASGLRGEVETKVPVALLGGFSGLEYTGQGDRYWAITDRGPADGAATYPCRFHELELSLPAAVTAMLRGNAARQAHDGATKNAPAGAGPEPVVITPKLIATRLLKDVAGNPLSGRSSLLPGTAADAAKAKRGTRFDPEAIRRHSDGSLWISDEYGPYVVRFDKSGLELERLTVPAKFLVARPAAARDDENNGNNSGRRANGGFEGLATTFAGDRLLALAQRPLIQDSAREGLLFHGVSCRLLELPLAKAAHRTNAASVSISVGGSHGGAQAGAREVTREVALSKAVAGGSEPRELLYPLDLPGNGLNEILAWDERHFLVIERDDAPGVEAKFKKIMICELTGASDVAGLERLPPREAPSGVRPIAKRVLIDLLDPQWKLAGTAFPEKIEGLARGPLLPDGRRLLVVGSDNDCDPTEPSRFWLFAVPAEL